MDNFSAVLFIIAVIVFVLLRLFWLWFWRINHIIDRLDRLTKIIETGQQGQIDQSVNQAQLLQQIVDELGGLRAQSRTLIEQGELRNGRDLIDDLRLPEQGVSSGIDAVT